MPTSLRPRRLTLLCWVAMMSLSIGLNLLPVFLTTISGMYGGAAGLTREQLGRLSAIAFAGVVAAIVVTGPLADRWGAKPFVQIGNGLIVAGLIGAGFAPDYAWLALAILALGIGAGTLDMVLSPVVAALNPERRSAAMNWLHSFYCVGAVLVTLAGSAAIAAGVSWRATCLLLLPMPAGLMAAFAPLRFPAMAAEGGRTRVRAMLGRGLLLALAAILLGGATELGLAQWLPAYSEKVLGYPTWVAGGSLLVFSLAMAVGRMVAGMVGDRIEPRRLMIAACIASAVLIVAGAFLPQPWAALTCCILAGLTGSCLWPTMLAVTADRLPDGGATMFALLAAFGNAGGIVMPWLVGWIADRSGLRLGLAVAALAPALMVALILRLRPLPQAARGPAASASAAR